MDAHFLALAPLSRADLQAYLKLIQHIKQHYLKGGGFRVKKTTVANLFFEPSTRTRLSFELAEKRLGLESMSLAMQTSSLAKGETLNDTIDNLLAMGVRVVVVRHASSGTAHTIAKHTRAIVINAGDGQHEHPTQGLLDLFTLFEHWGDFHGKTVTILGDIRHSRVARSNIHALGKMGATVRLFGPKTLVPKEFSAFPSVKIAHSMEEALLHSHAVIVLRLQKERMTQGYIPQLSDYVRGFSLTPERVLSLLPKDALILHPGPINREIEVASQVADSPMNRILQQVENGVFTRMAVLFKLLGGECI